MNDIGHEAVDRHAHGPLADHVAIHWLGAAGGEVRISYRELLGACNRFANAVTQLGLQRGDRLFVLAPRLPRLYAAVLGGLKAGLVVSPLFSAFGPEPIATRMNLGEARALVTTTTGVISRTLVNGEAPLGDLVSAAHRSAMAAELGITNPGGLRADIA